MQKSWVLRAATGIGHVIVEALLIILPKKSEGQTRTYRHMKLTFICPTGPCPAETSAASVQLKGYKQANSNRNAAYSQQLPSAIGTGRAYEIDMTLLSTLR